MVSSAVRSLLCYSHGRQRTEASEIIARKDQHSKKKNIT